MTVIGTRPEIIRLSCVIPKLDEHMDQVLVHTGQNYDYELNQVFFDDLGLRSPDRFLEVDTSSLGTVYGEVIIKSEIALREEQPDAVLILGDTNSAIAGLMARRMAIPIFHMEAGNRCFDWAVPEEMNRRVIDHISNYNLVYTEHARGALDELGLTENNYYLVSLHRQENVDDEAVCRDLFGSLFALAERDDLPVIVSAHPRTRNRLESFGLVEGGGVRFMKPFGFHDYNRLQLSARTVISDSGTIGEEASLLGFPAVSPRSATERPEGIDVGCFILAERSSEGMHRAIDVVAASAAAGVAPRIPIDYQVPNTSDVVLRAITGFAHRP